jgi:hypothetical protein
MAVPLARRVNEVVNRPSANAALAIIELTAVWALLAAVAWVAHFLALAGCGRWGARIRERVRERGRRGRADR